MKKYPIIVLGGTFDLLHAGHRKFLQEVLEKGEKVVIGLTSDKYISEYKPNRKIASFEIRKKNLEQFFNEEEVEERVEIIPIDDLYGPLLDSHFHPDAIAVTSDSRDGAEKVNQKRVELGLKPLEIVEVKLVKDQSGEVISSTRLRQNLLLPSTLRHLLQDVWGEVINTIPSNLDLNKVITVGDITTGKFLEKNLYPKVIIIDNKVERKDKIFSQKIPPEYQMIKVGNSPGEITKKLSRAVKNAFSTSKTAIIVEGEEDLAVLPALLYAPIRFSIFYGQPGVGLVHIKVTQELKEKAKDILDRFEIV